MTPKQTAKFLRSDEFAALAKLEYPYGLNEEVPAELEKINLVCNMEQAKRKEWRAVCDVAQGDGWDSTPERLEEFHLVSSAENNAVDMIKEGHHADNTLAYYLACFSTLECLRNDRP